MAPQFTEYSCLKLRETERVHFSQAPTGCRATLGVGARGHGEAQACRLVAVAGATMKQAGRQPWGHKGQRPTSCRDGGWKGGRRGAGESIPVQSLEVS